MVPQNLFGSVPFSDKDRGEKQGSQSDGKTMQPLLKLSRKVFVMSPAIFL